MIPDPVLAHLGFLLGLLGAIVLTVGLAAVLAAWAVVKAAEREERR